MGFEGWYFKHQKGDDTAAFIPGRAEDGAFLQILTTEGSRQFPISNLSVRGQVIQADGCRFSPTGCRIDLPGFSGTLAYGSFTPLRSDIMGPFRFLPMECRHGVWSMVHSLRGTLILDGVPHCFDGGKGYAEWDRGRSFPGAYFWVQCSDFSEPCSLMAAIARIPFFGRTFSGCICALMYRGREYRLATYRGVRIHAAGPNALCLTQGPLRLEVDLWPNPGHPLAAPIEGHMDAVIREQCNVSLRVRLWEQDRPVLDLRSPHGVCEWTPELK